MSNTYDMYDYNEIDKLKSERRKLEYMLTEERFHLESIPKRKALTKSKAMHSLIYAIPCTLAMLILIVALFLILVFGGGNVIAGVFVVLFPLAAYVLGFFSIKIWAEFFASMSLIWGTKKKELNYGSSNYTEEEKKSQAKIQSINKKLLGINKAILEYNSMLADSIMEPETNKQSGLPNSDNYSADEEFFIRALGKWGDDKETLIANMHSDKYEEEARSLQALIDEEKLSIINLAHRLAVINSDYDYIKNKFFLCAGSIVLMLFLQFFVAPTYGAVKAIAIIGAVYTIFISLYVYVTCKNKYYAYQVEYQPNKYSEYAENHGMVTISSLHQKCTRKIENYSDRLDYVNTLLDYKHNILKLN